MEYCVDLQCYKLYGKLIVCKELAIIPLVDFDMKPEIFLFKPSCPWDKLSSEDRKTNNFIQKRLHMIPYDSGNLSARDFFRIVQRNLKNSRQIYVKGTEKQRILSDILYDR